MKTKKLTIAGMFVWNVSIEYDGWTRTENKTIMVATRRRTLIDAQKKAASHLRAFRYDYPKARIVGIEYDGLIHA